MYRITPCWDCPDRYPGCHSKCQKTEYLKDEARKQLIREAKFREHSGKRNSIHWAKRNTGGMEE